jgi:hypothetical protein
MPNRRIQKISLALLTLVAGLGVSVYYSSLCYAADEKGQEIVVHVDCSQQNLITLGYKYASGANPYTLQGKCIKLHNVKAIQYFGKDKALASWSYRGNHGVVYLEAPENQALLGDSRVVLGMCVGVYSYKSSLDTPSQVPHIIVSQ